MAIFEEYLDPSPRAPDSPCSFSASSIIFEDEFAFTTRTESPVDDDFRMTAELESRALNDQADDGLDTISVDFDTVLGLVGEEQAKKMFEQSAPMKQKKSQNDVHSSESKSGFDFLFEYVM